jgi:glycosyltransferase involved in cell wall biosynthesis
MCFRNESRTLGLAIQSVLAQTYSNWELLLWDDGSTDGSLEIARSFGVDGRVRLFSDGHRRWLSTRLNASLDLARGEYFARMDADDISYPERFEKQVRFMQANPDIDLVSTYIAVMDEEGRAYGKMSCPTVHEAIVNRALFGFRMFHPTWLGRIGWFRHYRYRPEALFVQDQDLLLRAYRDSRFAVIPELLLGYRQGKPTLSKLMRTRWFWFCHVRRYLKGRRGFSDRLRVGVIVLLKAAVDCTAVLTGLNYRLLRHRAEPLTETEQKAVADALCL